MEQYAPGTRTSQRDAVIDWVKVNNQNPRKATWLHCNGVIGFDDISNNFN